jgi:uncharacterized protein YlxW (UPF0749 family)
MTDPMATTWRPARPHQHSSREEYAGPLPDRVTMPLLELVTREAVDQDYADAARRRARRQAEARARGEEPEGGKHNQLGWVVAGTAVFGLLIALAAVQNSRDADVDAAGRQTLIDRVDSRKAEVAGAERRIDDLRAGNADTRDLNDRLGAQLRAATSTLSRLQVDTGAVAVSGPGVRITVDDSADGSSDGRIRATDLRLVVNGLWESGADAIAVNGRRLTVLSAITNSSIAINVNQQPLTPPYVVSAIGDEQTLSADQLRTASGVQFATLAQQFGYRVQRDNVDALLLPAASPNRLRLRYAEIATPGPHQDRPATEGEETP